MNLSELCFATPIEGKTFDVQIALEKDNPNDLLMAIRFAANHILSLDQLSFDGKAHEQHWFNKKETEPRKKAFLKAAGLVKKGYMLCGTLAEVEPYNQEIAFYDAVRANFN
ncbi:type I restriction enzyme HindVIIP R protein [Haemophilus influenzae]|uniref:Type I restriction enzyme HindVIIP R protein n=1 Tax=Haemophilus influenzae TaxID=727 RepID=A0A2X1RT32_HAEIF|nr:type I restriction enzyme HindVIIP R protein [Haemophilus influenzae]